jgi:hypothetical protein
MKRFCSKSYFTSIYGVIFMLDVTIVPWVLEEEYLLVQKYWVLYWWLILFFLSAQAIVVVKAVCYKTGDHGFETRWRQWFFFQCTWSFRPHCTLGFTRLLKELSNRSKKIKFLGVDRDLCVGLTTLPPSVSKLSRECGILNISQPYRPVLSVTGMILLLLLQFFFVHVQTM